jgi:hypothetical protein
MSSQTDAIPRVPSSDELQAIMQQAHVARGRVVRAFFASLFRRRNDAGHDLQHAWSQTASR